MLPPGNVVYTQETNSVSNYTPTQVDQYIDLLEFGPNGDLFLGTSSLNKRSWTGDIWWFGAPEDAPDREKARTGYRIDSGIVSGKYIGKNQFLLGLDSGGVQVLTTNTTRHETKGTPFHFFELQPSLCEHDDQLSDVDMWTTTGENHLVTVSREGRIVVWNQNLAVVHNYHPAHISGILSVTCHPTNNSVFATAGSDGKIKVWDTRESKPCETVYSDPNLPPGVISWNPNLPNTLLVAARTGTVFNLEVGSRKVSSPLSVSDRELRIIRWSPDRPHLCALAGDDVTVSVLNVEGGEIKPLYSNQSHRDFVRGLAWSPVNGSLWSGGWDKQVLSHVI